MSRELGNLLRSHAQRTPSKPAFRFHGSDRPVEVGYAQLVDDLDHCLSSRQYGQPGELVFITSAIRYESITAYLACVLGHAIPAFLSPWTPRQDRNIHATEMQLLLERFHPNLLVDAEGARRLHAQRNPALADHDGFLQFSSGTTSLKKGVLITLDKLDQQLASLGTALAITHQDKIASWLPLYHDMGLITSLFLPLYHGCTVDYLDPVEWSFRPDTLFDVIGQQASTLCWQPDFAFRHLCNFYRRADKPQPRNLSSLRALISCSEPCRASTFQEFQQAFRPFSLPDDCLQTSYAMAETVFAVSQSQTTVSGELAVRNDILSSGQPVAGCNVRIVNPMEEGVGAIQIRSPFLFDGYLNQATESIASDGWYNTGDLGSLAGGELFVVGRVDDTLVVNGKKIIAHQIEQHIGAQPGFKPGRIFCTVNADHSALVVYFEGDNSGTTTFPAVRKWVSSSSGVSLDRLVELPLGTLVKSSSGKIARKKTLAKLDALGSLVAS